MVKSSKIYLRNVRFHAYHGVLEQENTVGNDYLVNLSLEYDFSRAMQTDELSGTINYAEVVERLRHDLETRHFQLLEKLAEHVAGVVLEDFGAAWVRVSVAKIGVLRGVKRVGVTIERSRAA